jgi:hypothetical protein
VDAPTAALLALATAAALFTPVLGTLYFGQVNCYLLPFLALALRRVRPAAGIAVPAAVKLYPAAAMLAFATMGRRGLRPLLVTAGLTGTLVVLPNLVTGTRSYGGSLLANFGPDAYWSNESVNGWLSRLALPSGAGPPPLPGLPVTPIMLAACALLGLLVALVIAAAPRRPWAGTFALLLCYSVVAAPKNSLWNYAPLVVAMVHWWSASGRRRRDAAVLGLAWTLVSVQGVVDLAELHLSHPPGVVGALSSAALAGGLALLALLAVQLVTTGAPAGPAQAGTTSSWTNLPSERRAPARQPSGRANAGPANANE